MDLDLAGRIAVVSGAAQGIGLAIAEALVAEGCRLLMIDRQKSVMEAAEGIGGTGFVCNLADAASAGLVRRAADAVGPCAVLINNAGVSKPAHIDAVSDEDWRSVMDVNVDAAFRLTREFWPRLVTTKGSIVNLASFAGKRATLFGDNASYVASKHAIVGLTRAAAMDGAARGVRVNAVAPGVVATDLVKLHDEATRERIATMIPLGHYARPEEIADAVVFLASRRASHITGEILNVNGGLVMD